MAGETRAAWASILPNHLELQKPQATYALSLCENNSAHRVQDISWNESQHFVVDNFQLLIADLWWQLCFWKGMSEGLLA